MRGVRQPEQFGDDHTRLSQSQVFRLQSGEHKVGILRLDGRGQHSCHTQRIAPARVVADDVNRAIRAFREGFANRGTHALRPGAHHNDLAAGFLF